MNILTLAASFFHAPPRQMTSSSASEALPVPQHGAVQASLRELNDAALMKLAGGGDENAFCELVQRHEQWARTFAGRILRDFTEAEDVVQEAFLRAWIHAPRWQPIASFRQWLRTVLSRACIDNIRKKRPEPVAELPEIEARGADAFAHAATEEEHRILASLIDELPERQRLALMLTYTEELTMRESAEVMEISAKAFESLLIRARAQLRGLWQKRLASS
ncbi:sigma-70 family RNA polymerase sigma factor [Candidatus Sumerlaeota bacterium]|nr:sigma-70 family RNA polymerase sigma factor [Candidatus Sumerlaeota bacterium]